MTYATFSTFTVAGAFQAATKTAAQADHAGRAKRSEATQSATQKTGTPLQAALTFFGFGAKHPLRDC